jgi:ribosomal protein S27E
MAIVVIKENPVPRQEVTCESCGSILEYGNADLQPATTYSSGHVTSYKIKCPVCGVYVRCDWIKK